MSQTAILVKEKGVVRIDKPFDFMCSQLRNGRYKVVIERYTEPRTISQNALMWLWFTCIEQETGTDKQDVHDWKSHATLTLLAKQDCPLWLQYD